VDPRLATIAVRVRPAAFYSALAVFVAPPVLMLSVLLTAVLHPWAGVALLVLVAVAAALVLPRLHDKGYTYLTVNAAGVRYQPISTATKLGTDRVLALGSRDALVATGQALFVWRNDAGAWQEVGVHARWAHPADWARLCEWTRAVWPDHHRPAV